MKTVRLPKPSRLYLWILLLILAVIFFTLLRSPAAGHHKASQGLQQLNVSDIEEGVFGASRPEPPAGSPESSANVPSPPVDDGNLIPLPVVMPEPAPYPKLPRNPCPPWPPTDITQEIICLDSY